jgi:capsular polysaccharide transport system permease protein
MHSEEPYASKSIGDRIVRRIENLSLLFIATVIIPTFIATLYFGLIASDVYISESHFTVRTQGKQSMPNIAALIKGSDASSTGIEGKAVEDYVKSRDALQILNKNGRIKEIYTRPNIDFLSRYDDFLSSDNNEALFKYYGKRVTIEENSGTQIIAMRVRAYSAKDAYWINERLLEQSEALVNVLNQRSRDDVIRYAVREVEEAQQKASTAAMTLARFRNREGVIDPEKQATASLQMISKLQDDLSASKTQLVQLKLFAPANPQAEVLEARVKGLEHEIDEQLGKVAGGRRSLADTAVQYQRLSLESQLADRLLASALATLEAARNDARRQQAYVERIVQPNEPDAPLEPKRLRGILSTLALGLVVWGILTMLYASLKEHQD